MIFSVYKIKILDFILPLIIPLLLIIFITGVYKFGVKRKVERLRDKYITSGTLLSFSVVLLYILFDLSGNYIGREKLLKDCVASQCYKEIEGELLEKKTCRSANI